MSKLVGSDELCTEADAVVAGEAALVRRARKGDSDAFAELVRRYQRRAVSLAYRLLGNIEDAGDVAQEAFVRAYRHLSQLDDPSRFGAWFMRVVTNRSLNFRRARTLRFAASLDDAQETADDASTPAGRKRATAQSQEDGGSIPDELRAAISAAMEQLPEKQRLALVLFSIEGMPQKEVAEILDCSIELVKWNVFQARRKLKGLLAPYLE